MDKYKKKLPNRRDLPHLIEKVPAEHRDHVKDLCYNILLMVSPMTGHPVTLRWEPMGRGKFGRVYLSREGSTHYMVAMKVMFKTELQKGYMQRQVLREIEIQSRLKHPHILRLLTWFHDTGRKYLAVELASQGDLFKILRQAPNNRFDEPRVAKYK